MDGCTVLVVIRAVRRSTITPLQVLHVGETKDGYQVECNRDGVVRTFLRTFGVCLGR